MEAPDASVEVPLRLTFEVDADAIPALPLSVFRDGLEVGNCTSTGAAADPDPCLERPFLTDGDGDLLITVRSSHASLWQLGVPEAFPFRGFFAPVNNFSVTNLASAGRAIPIKFSLDGDRGLDIFEPGYPKSQAVDCDSSAKIDGIESAASASSLPLTYDKTTGQYTYVWKTAREWTGSCRELVVKLVDGSSHPATFRFK